MYCTYNDGNIGVVSYTSKNTTQFFDCSNINGIIPNASIVGINTYAYGTSNLDNTKTIKVRIGSVLEKLEPADDTLNYEEGDTAQLKTLGITGDTFKGKNWFYNIAPIYKLSLIHI